MKLGNAGRWPEAIDQHEKAVQYDPRSKQFRINLSSAHVAYGEALIKSGDMTAAAAQFREALGPLQTTVLRATVSPGD